MGDAGVDDAAEVVDLALKDVAVQEQERRQRLVLRRGTDVVGDCKVSEKGVDLGLGHLGGVAQVVEVDEAAHPEAVRLLGPLAVVARAQGQS